MPESYWLTDAEFPQMPQCFPVAAGHAIVQCDWLYLTSVVKSGKNVHRVNQQDFDRANAATSHGIKDLGEGRGLFRASATSRFPRCTQEVAGDVHFD
ncbi:hypothetical protein B1A87_009370 [Arthrobacter sp. KBS0703]|nr:hypothetical protein B1A87_009370 [Arthrobacter sp. KBS0703]